MKSTLFIVDYEESIVGLQSNLTEDGQCLNVEARSLMW
jgi:hypothetical protein